MVFKCTKELKEAYEKTTITIVIDLTEEMKHELWRCGIEQFDIDTVNFEKNQITLEVEVEHGMR